MEENKGKNIEKRSNFSDKIASLIVYISYSKNKTLVYVLSLTVIGFILRLISALNMNVLADDMLYASQSAGIISQASSFCWRKIFWRANDFSIFVSPSSGCR